MPVDDLFEAAREAGVTVEYCSIPLNQSVSIQDDGGDFALMDYGLIWGGAEERVHLGHELGHCCTGSFYDSSAPLLTRRRCERRADKWAIKKLIPKDELDAAVADGRTEICELAEIFGVTEDFMRKAVCWHEHGAF